MTVGTRLFNLIVCSSGPLTTIGPIQVNRGQETVPTRVAQNPEGERLIP